MTSPLLLPALAQAGLTFALYPLLTWARARAVRRGVDAYQAFEFTDGEDPFAARVSANLRNQFEAPLLFYVAVILLTLLEADGPIAAGLAWVFVAGRLAHTGVQILTADVRLRGLVFTVNFAALAGMWALLAPVALGEALIRWVGVWSPATQAFSLDGQRVVIDLPAEGEIHPILPDDYTSDPTAATVVLRPYARDPLIIVLTLTTADAAPGNDVKREDYDRTADWPGAAALAYVLTTEEGGSGGEAHRLWGRLTLPEAVFDVSCLTTQEWPSVREAGTWCLPTLATLAAAPIDVRGPPARFGAGEFVRRPR